MGSAPVNAHAHATVNALKLPVYLMALGNEVRRLQDYHARGLITQSEADERLSQWELFYPIGWVEIEKLAGLRRWGVV
jgi:hypothetical protein